MPIIIEDHQSSTGSSDIINIPGGRHHPVLLNFATAHSWDDSTPGRGTPSGGGGSWIYLGDASVNWFVSDAERYYFINMIGYAWYSIPTAEGDTTITFGSATSEDGQRDYLYSLSNAEYSEFGAVGPFNTTTMGDTMQINKQGGSVFGCSMAALKSSFTGGVTPLYSTKFDGTGGVAHPDTATEAYSTATHTRYPDIRSSSGMFARNSVRWNAVTPVITSGIYVALDAVECTI